MPEERRRRTERLFLSYAIRVDGMNADGKRFSETTRTIVVNRHGARILLKNPVTAGQTVQITHVHSDRAAEFRVVGLAASRTEQGGEWGVECRDEKKNLWGINFPPMDETAASSSVLLECRKCREVTLTPITMVDYDLLESTDLLTKECNTCKELTSWEYARTPAGVPEPAQAATLAVPATAPAATPAAGPAVERRASHRVSLRLPIRVRGPQDLTDLTKSENVSKGGLAFTSGKVFEPGETLLVTCPYNPTGDNIEVRGRVVRRVEVAGTGRYLYGVEYLK